jgi:dinuclear metal center YbgI/SA1388 family protein
MKLTAFAERLDRLLAVGKFKDCSNNGLQLANRGEVTRVLAGVDASLRLLREAEARGADCVVCHHGISWGDSLARLTGLNHALVSFALSRNIAIYAAHLPLDAHPKLGNNAQLCRALGLGRARPAFSYHGETIGLVGAYPRALSRDAFHARVRRAVSADLRTLDFGPARVRTVGVVSGGAADMADQAAALGADVFLTGEASLQGYVLAENLGLNVVFAGHYATETFGVRALAELLPRQLGLPAEFADFRIPF